MDFPGVSVVVPVRNEERHLRSSVQGILDQHYPGPIEIILSVGPSEDATAEIAENIADGDPRIRVVDNPSGYTPTALNTAIAASTHDIIVRVDAHGELGERYIETAVELLNVTGAANVGGRMDAQGRTPFEEAVAAAYNSRLGLGGGGFHLRSTPAGPAETVFLGVFRKDILLEVGGFDEGMHRAQDWELNYRLRQAGYLVYFSPEMRVTYRPRSSVRALAKQFYLTGQWRREVIKRYPETASPRYLAPPAVLSAVTLGAAVGVLGVAGRKSRLRLGLLAPLAYFSGVLIGSTTMPKISSAGRLRLPLVLTVMHMSWGLGFLKGRQDDKQSS